MFILSYFANSSMNNGRVSTDGTIPGTTVFSETNSKENYYPCNGKLLYGQNGLSITDGSVAGTSVLDSFNTFTSGDIATIGNNVYFFSRNDLFVTDGTPVGTNKVADTVVPIGFATAFLSITQTLDNKNVRLSVLDNKLYFMSDKAMLWESDGTKAGTKPLLQATSIDSNGSGGIYKLNRAERQALFPRRGQLPGMGSMKAMALPPARTRCAIPQAIIWICAWTGTTPPARADTSLTLMKS